MAEKISEHKWFLKSVTIWGAIIGIITQYWPLLNTFLKTEIDVTMISQFGDMVAALLSQVGMIISFVMVVWGRLRATTELTVTK